MADTYTAPEVLSSIDVDEIHARMLNNLPSNIDKTEGGFAYDMTRPTAMEKADAMLILNEIVKLFFPEWSYGIFLDNLGKPSRIYRRAATAATATLHITGTAGTEIPAGFVFATAATAISSSVLYTSLEDASIGSGGTVDVQVQCTETGTVGNVPSDCIVLMVEPLEEITGVTNPNPATGGTETEDDDSLRSRIIEYERSDNSSYVGCDSDYKRWALEVDGVGSVIVVPEWQGRGSGTVKLIVMDANGEPASQTIQANVYNHIISESNRDERLAPIGAILTVATATAVNVSIAASVHLETGAVLADIEEAYEAAIQEYFAEAKAEGYVRVTRIGSVLSETPGVLDYESLTLNSGTSNVAVGADYYPVLLSITLTDADAVDDDDDEGGDDDGGDDQGEEEQQEEQQDGEGE